MSSRNPNLVIPTGTAALPYLRNPGIPAQKWTESQARTALDTALTDSIGSSYGTFTGESRHMPSGAWRFGVRYPHGVWYWTIWQDPGRPHGVALKGGRTLGKSRSNPSGGTPPLHDAKLSWQPWSIPGTYGPFVGWQIVAADGSQHVMQAGDTLAGTKWVYKFAPYVGSRFTHSTSERDPYKKVLRLAEARVAEHGGVQARSNPRRSSKVDSDNFYNPGAKGYTQATFDRAYWGPDWAQVPAAVRREFWSDFRYAHNGSLRSYKAATTSGELR